MKKTIIKATIRAYEFLSTLWFHRRIIKHLQAELKKPFEVRLQEMKISASGRVQAHIVSPAFEVWAAEITAMFHKNSPKAINFMSFTVCDPDVPGESNLGVYEIVIQNKNAKTPVELLSEAKKNIIVLQGLLNETTPYAVDAGNWQLGLRVSEILANLNLQK